jgi:hypothetical protein
MYILKGKKGKEKEKEKMAEKNENKTDFFFPPGFPPSPIHSSHCS